MGSFSPNPSDVPDDRVQHYSGVAASTSTALQYAAPLAEIVKVRMKGSLGGRKVGRAGGGKGEGGGVICFLSLADIVNVWQGRG